MCTVLVHRGRARISMCQHAGSMVLLKALIGAAALAAPFAAEAKTTTSAETAVQATGRERPSEAGAHHDAGTTKGSTAVTVDTDVDTKGVRPARAGTQPAFHLLQEGAAAVFDPSGCHALCGLTEFAIGDPSIP